MGNSKLNTTAGEKTEKIPPPRELREKIIGQKKKTNKVIADGGKC